MNIINVQWWSSHVELQLLLFAYVQELLHAHLDRIWFLSHGAPYVWKVLLYFKEFESFGRWSSCMRKGGHRYILTYRSNNTRTRMVAKWFQHSGETMSRHFNRVLKALWRYNRHITKPRRLDETPPEIQHHSK